MKKLCRKAERYDLRLNYIMFAFPILIWICFMLSQIIKIANDTFTLVAGARFIIFSVTVLFMTVILSGVVLYKKSISYILWYREILDSFPIPIIVTDKKAEWQYANKATYKIINPEQYGKLKSLNSRHLVTTDGNIVNKVLLHNGATYRTAGNNLYRGGKDMGYVIYLNKSNDSPDNASPQSELMCEINSRFKNLLTTTHHFSDCANNLSNHMAHQADIISDLSGIVTEIVSGNLNDPDTLKKRIEGIKNDVQLHTEVSQAHLEKMLQIVSELNSAI